MIDIFPSETAVGKLTEVYLYADEAQGFWQRKYTYIISDLNFLFCFISAIPSTTQPDNNDYGIKCKFGRFGSAPASYINTTTILCLTPNIADDPSDISEETVLVTVAMNGVDFNEYESEVNFMFIGTGSVVSTWVIIMGTLIFGLLILSIAIFLGGLQEFIRQKSLENIPRHSYTHQNQRGDVGPRIIPSRASSQNLGAGRRSAMPASRGPND